MLLRSRLLLPRVSVCVPLLHRNSYGGVRAVLRRRPSDRPVGEREDIVRTTPKIVPYFNYTPDPTYAQHPRPSLEELVKEFHEKHADPFHPPKRTALGPIAAQVRTREQLNSLMDIVRSNRKFRVPVSARTSLEIVRACWRVDAVDAAVEMIRSRMEYGLMPSRNCLHLLMHAVAQKIASDPSAFKQVVEIFLSIHNYGHKPNRVSLHVLLGACFANPTPENLSLAAETLSLPLEKVPSDRVLELVELMRAKELTAPLAKLRSSLAANSEALTNGTTEPIPQDLANFLAASSSDSGSESS